MAQFASFGQYKDMNVKRFFQRFITMPWSPRGRTMRIQNLIESTGEERDVCAATIYCKDAMLGRSLSEEEIKDLIELARDSKQEESPYQQISKDESNASRTFH